MIFEKEKLLIPWPDDLTIRSQFEAKEDGTVNEVLFPFNVDWDYYFTFSQLDFGDPATGKLFDQMNDALFEANVLCGFKKGAYGIMCNQGLEMRFRRSTYKYFTRWEFVERYYSYLIALENNFDYKYFIFQVC